MSKKTLALLNFSPEQQRTFSAILTLSSMNLDDFWQIVNKDNAQVIFVSSDHVMMQKQWHQIQLNHPQALLIAYSENLASLDIKRTLLTRMSSPPVRSLLINLLNGISAELKAVNNVNEIPLSEPQLATLPSSVKPVDSPVFLPENHFLGIIAKSIYAKENYYCQAPNGIQIYLQPQQHHYFCLKKITQLTSLFLRHPDEIKVHQLSEIELIEQTKTMKPKRINDLLWSATIIASQGRLMQNHQVTDIIHLKYWPDIAHIKTAENYLIIAAFMNRNTVDMKTIAGHTEQPLNDIINFHNACHILGLISHNEKFVLKSKPASDKLRQLRQRIFDTLRLNTTD